MKGTPNLYTLVIMTLLLACGQPANKDRERNIQNTTHPSDTEKHLMKKGRERRINEDGIIDSLRLDVALKDAFKIAEKAFGTNNFTRQYELQPDNSSYTINIEILVGKLFQDNQEYFLLRRHVPNQI
jgi:hypothetical protein